MGSYTCNAASNDYEDPIITERAIDEPRPLKVIYIGAGVSGICAAIQFQKFVSDLQLVIYEKNPDVGGTWFENRYPGCACDIPAHSYQLSYESEVSWSKFYVGAPEILEYWRRVVHKYDVRRFMKFGHRCVGARWNEDSCKWHVTLALSTGEILEDVGDVLVTGTGVLNAWKWPDIEGVETFKGKLLHSADWDPEYDPKGQRVAVIGAGSSGIQIVPALQPKVTSMDHYVRGKTWISASFGSELVRERNGQDGNFDYTQAEIESWKTKPELYVSYRKVLELGMQGNFALTHRGTEAHKRAWKDFEDNMRRKLKIKSHIADHLIPDFPPLCKRLTPGPGYLEALVAQNVNVITDKIAYIDSTGITTVDGVHREVDTIITATGFDTSFQGQFPVYGREGINLQDRNKKRAESYLGVAIDGFPNFFHSLGPNSGLGNGNLILVIESVANYIGQILARLAAGNTKSIEPKRKSVENFTNYCDSFFRRTVFSAECDSWYKLSRPGASPAERKQGRITALWPGSSIHATKALQKVRFEDYEMTTVDGNEFGWMGNGWAVAERTGDVEGLTWYLNNTGFMHQNSKSTTSSGLNSDRNVSIFSHSIAMDGEGATLAVPDGVIAT